MKITLAKSAGFCFGVKRAVDTVYEQLEMSAAERQPIYTFGPIIHNEEVVRDLEEKGVTVLESVEELEERAAHGGTVIIRAHGVEKDNLYAAKVMLLFFWHQSTDFSPIQYARKYHFYHILIAVCHR